MGGLVFTAFIIQAATGVTMTFYYVPDVSRALLSVESPHLSGGFKNSTMKNGIVYEVDGPMCKGPEQEEPVLVLATRLVVNIAKTSTWIPLVESRRPDDDEAMTNG
jgi:hypothetical protein